MRYQRLIRVVLASLLAVWMGIGSANSIQAQQPAPAASPAGAPPPASDSVLTGMAAVTGTLGSIFYIPFKAFVICPGMALASGASLAVTGGNKDTAVYLLRTGCTGTYFIMPAMVRGQEEFHGAGEH